MAITITSVTQLKKILEIKAQQALILTQEEIYEVIQHHIERYYQEEVFSPPDTLEPDFYKRTYQFLNSLIKTNIVQTGATLACSVEIDNDYLRYKYPGNPSWKDNISATGLQVASWANEGLHGGSVSGNISFWDDAMQELGGKQGIINIMKKNLKRVGMLVV